MGQTAGFVADHGLSDRLLELISLHHFVPAHEERPRVSGSKQLKKPGPQLAFPFSPITLKMFVGLSLGAGCKLSKLHFDLS